MSEIDWSKAPEGAQYWRVSHGCWYMVDGDRAYVFRAYSCAWDRSTEFNAETIEESSDFVKRPSSPAWNGEGLPPVGTFIVNADDYKGRSEVILHRHGQALVEQEDGVAADYVLFGKSECRLAPTPEQIAAEEREKAAKDMATLMTGHEDHKGEWGCYVILGEILYDAGYRKTGEQA